MNLRFALLGLALGAATAFAADGTEPFSADAARWGTATRIVEPKYPPAAIAQGRTATIAFSGVVSPVGELQDVRFGPVDDANRDLLAALEEVLSHWRFQTPEDNHCMPATDRVSTLAAFELRDGKPHFTVTHERGERFPDLREDERVERMPTPRYPRDALREGIEAIVYSRMEIDAEGRITSVSAKAYPEAEHAHRFEHAVSQALHRWRYPPAAPDRVRPRVACQSFHFRMAN